MWDALAERALIGLPLLPAVREAGADEAAAEARAAAEVRRGGKGGVHRPIVTAPLIPTQELVAILSAPDADSADDEFLTAFNAPPPPPTPAAPSLAVAVLQFTLVKHFLGFGNKGW